MDRPRPFARLCLIARSFGVPVLLVLAGCGDGASFPPGPAGVSALRAYIKASNTEAADEFGRALALSGDGNTLAVGAPFEDSAATGIGGDQADNSAGGAGAVYIYIRSGATWVQQAYVKASNAEAGDAFGIAVALSADGNTLAVGARGEASAATGIDGDQADNIAANAGAVYVFTRSGIVWTQQAYIKSSNTAADDQFGFAVASSSDGNTLVVGAPGEDSSATGIGGNQADNGNVSSGAVYVFARSGIVWMQQAYIKASNTGSGDQFGSAVAASSDGNTLAVGAPGEDSFATGIGGFQADNSAPSSGAAYIYTRSGAVWTQQAYVKALNTGVNDQFGSAIALSGDGNTLAVGAALEDSAASGVGGNQADNTALNAGAAYLYFRSGAAWMQLDYVKASNTGADDRFGVAVALSGDGKRLVVGAHNEDSADTGIGGIQADNSAANAGAVYVFE